MRIASGSTLLPTRSPSIRTRPSLTSRWSADPTTWHFLTGPIGDVQRVCHLFGVDSFPDEGLMNHSLHTAIIDRQGKIVANIEGNQFTARQLGDLTEAVLNSRR